MKIQIWGKSKCFDTKKAERYFKERRNGISCAGKFLSKLRQGDRKSTRLNSSHIL